MRRRSFFVGVVFFSIIGSVLIFVLSNRQIVKESPVIPLEKNMENMATSLLPKKETAFDEASDRPSIENIFEKEFDGRDFSIGRVLDRNAAYTRYFVTYKSGNLVISGIMNVPSGSGPFPILILNHGYIDPSIYTNGRGLRREQDYLARRGFVVAHPDYRNHAESTNVDDDEWGNRLGYVEDVINAVVALRASGLPFLDRDAVGMLGHSMGGGIAQTIAVSKPDLVKAFVLYAPVSMDARDSYFKYMNDDTARAARIADLYGLPEETSSIWDELSPQTYVDRILAPILLFQGTNDKSVPMEWSEKTAALLKERGKSIETIFYERETHEFGPKWTDFMERTVEFFQKNIRVDSGSDVEDDRSVFLSPMDRAKDRVTKKPFGIFVDPAASPVSPERFRGYHTGIDFEIFSEEAEKDVEVRSICSGEIREARRANGYGGIVVQKCLMRDESVTVVYGHIRLSSIRKSVGEKALPGEVLAILGTSGELETDGERKHLHLGIRRGNEVDIRGYVSSREALSEWVDSCDFFCKKIR